jgi:hypothetical protein
MLEIVGNSLVDLVETGIRFGILLVDVGSRIPNYLFGTLTISTGTVR